MPLVYTRVEDGVACDPVPIHQYLDGEEDEAETPGGGERAAEDVADPGAEEQG